MLRYDTDPDETDVEETILAEMPNIVTNNPKRRATDVDWDRLYPIVMKDNIALIGYLYTDIVGEWPQVGVVQVIPGIVFEVKQDKSTYNYVVTDVRLEDCQGYIITADIAPEGIIPHLGFSRYKEDGWFCSPRTLEVCKGIETKSRVKVDSIIS